MTMLYWVLPRIAHELWSQLENLIPPNPSFDPSCTTPHLDKSVWKKPLAFTFEFHQLTSTSFSLLSTEHSPKSSVPESWDPAVKIIMIMMF